MPDFAYAQGLIGISEHERSSAVAEQCRLDIESSGGGESEACDSILESIVS